MGVPILDIAIIGKHAILATNDARHKVALLIGISHTLFVDHSLSRGRKVAPDLIQTILNLTNLLHRYRSASIALHTAFALANAEVATELLRQNLRRKEHIANLKNRGKSSQLRINN